MTWQVSTSQSDFLINNLICPTLLGTSKGQLGGSCWRSLTTISRRQLDQKIMRVCISYTHPYPIKFLNHTLPFRICKLCLQANMQVTNTLWPDTKSQKISEYRFRLKWTKWSPRTEANPAGAGRASTLGQGETKTSPLQEVGGGWRPGQADRPTWSAGQARGPHRLNQGTWRFPVGSQRRFGVLRLVAPCYK